MINTPIDVTTTPFTLPPDAKVVQVSDLSPRLRARIGPVPASQAVVTRPGFRVTTRLVPGPLALLLGEFRRPTLLSDAVLRFARAQARDPLDTMDAAFDGLANLVDARILVPAGSPDFTAPEPSLAAGQSCAGFEIDALVRSLEDTEVYRAHGPDGAAAALKIARRDRPHAAATLAHEAQVLRALESGDVPRLLAAGDDDGRAYVAMTWCAGVSVVTAAQRLRASGQRARVLALVGRMLEAYARLHGRGVLHGDVHPGNCLVDDDGRVVLLDFGTARRLDQHGGLDPARTGIPQFYDPQLAEALLDARVPPRGDAASEQYAVAVLAYLLFTGLHPIEAPAEQHDLLRRIAGRPMLPFAARGVPAWPDVEAVLARALSHRPADRFATMADFAAALLRARTPRPGSRRAGPVTAAFDTAVETVREVLPAPCSGEQRWFALRAALLLEDAELLAVADVLSAHPDGDWSAHVGATLVARARCDTRRERQAIAAFLAAVEPLDRGATRRAALYAATHVLDGARVSTGVEEVARWTGEQVTQHLAESTRGRKAPPVDALDLYVALALAKAGVGALPPGVPGHLQRLATSTTAPRRTGPCGPGLVWLWAIAYDVYADPRFLRLALETSLPAAPLPRVLALLRRYQVTGDARLVARARQVAGRRDQTGRASFELALMATELAAPERMCPPPFMNPFAVAEDHGLE